MVKLSERKKYEKSEMKTWKFYLNNSSKTTLRDMINFSWIKRQILLMLQRMILLIELMLILVPEELTLL
jgi:hypothetical protein